MRATAHLFGVYFYVSGIGKTHLDSNLLGPVIPQQTHTHKKGTSL